VEAHKKLARKTGLLASRWYPTSGCAFYSQIPNNTRPYKLSTPTCTRTTTTGKIFSCFPQCKPHQYFIQRTAFLASPYLSFCPLHFRYPNSNPIHHISFVHSTGMRHGKIHHNRHYPWLKTILAFSGFGSCGNHFLFAFHIHCDFHRTRGGEHTLTTTTTTIPSSFGRLFWNWYGGWGGYHPFDCSLLFFSSPSCFYFFYAVWRAC